MSQFTETVKGYLDVLDDLQEALKLHETITITESGPWIKVTADKEYISISLGSALKALLNAPA